MSQKNGWIHEKEKKKSKVSFVCSVAVLVILCLGFRQADRILITEPAQREAKQKEDAARKAEKEASTPKVTTQILWQWEIICFTQNYMSLV